MTTDRRDDNHRPPEADGADTREGETGPGTTADDGITFASLFERSPATVSLDDVATALRSVRSGDGE